MDDSTRDSDTPTLTAARVLEITKDCLFEDEELSPDGSPPLEAVVVSGILNRFGFHPGRLEQHRDEICAMLDELPDDFRSDAGGGWSFLNACRDRSDRHWGEHVDMDRLFSLGQALGVVSCILPREMWSALPGGMPYYSINTPASEDS